jgi:hypothetical protein
MVNEVHLNFGSIATSLFCLIFYHVILFSGTFSNQTQLFVNIRNSVKFVLKHRERNDAASVTLAIQTFRNTILVAIFVGGTAFSAAFSFVDDYQTYLEDPVQQSRSVILSTFLLCSFLCMACVIRFVSHLGYLVGTMSYIGSTTSTPPIVSVTPPSSSAIPPNTTTVSADPNTANTIIPTDPSQPQPTADSNIGKSKEAQEINYSKQCTKLMSLNMIFFRSGFRK